MMDKQRDAFVDEIHRIEEAMTNTNSAFLKRDYMKALRRMKRELKEYDEYHNCLAVR